MSKRTHSTTSADLEAPVLSGGGGNSAGSSRKQLLSDNSSISAASRQVTTDLVTDEEAMTLQPTIEETELQDFYAKSFFQRWKPIFKIILFTVFAGVGSSMVGPLRTHFSTEYYGSPQKAGQISAYIQAAQALINMMLVPFYGQLLDTVGRRPCYIAGAFIGALQATLFAAFPQYYLIYIVLSCVGSFIQGSYVTAYLADHFPAAIRPKVFPMTMAIGQFTALGAIVDIVKVPYHIVLWASAVCQIVQFIAVVILFDESLPIDLRKPATELCQHLLHNPFGHFGMLIKSKAIRLSVIILCIVLVAQVGTGDIVQYYLEYRIGMKPDQFAVFFIEVSLLAPVIMMGIFPCLMKFVTPVIVLIISLLAVCGEQIILATVWAAWPLYAFAVPMDIISLMAIPIVTSLVSNAGTKADQGVRATTLAAVGDLTSAIGSIAFGAAYGNMPLKYAWIPFVVSAAVCLGGVALAFNLSASLSQESGEGGEETEALEGQEPTTVNSSTYAAPSAVEPTATKTSSDV